VEKTHVTGEIMGFPALEFPGALGKVGSRFRAPFVVKNYKSESVIVKLSSVVSDGAELLERAVTVTVPSRGSSRLYVPIVLPSSLVPGDYQKTVTLAFENDIRISPTEGVLHFTYTGAGGISLPRINPVILLYIAIAIAAVALLVVVFILLRRRLSEIPAAAGASAGAASSARAESGPRDDDAEARRARGRHRVPLMEVGREEASEADSPPKPRAKPTAENLKRSLPEVEHGDSTLTRMIEMRVSEQNSHIGFRNIHRIPEGGSRGIGGGFSTYLIFLVPLPRRIAEIRNDGSGYTFIPLRQEFFPALSGPVKNCLGVDIPMVTPKGLGFKIRFRAWISPLEEINALMRLSRS
jgi:hypothetical protein